MNKKMTLEGLARIIERGFAKTATKTEFKQLEHRVGGIEERLMKIDEKLVKIDDDIRYLNSSFQFLDERMRLLEQTITEIKEVLKDVVCHHELRELEKRVTILERKMTLKNA